MEQEAEKFIEKIHQKRLDEVYFKNKKTGSCWENFPSLFSVYYLSHC